MKQSNEQEVTYRVIYVEGNGYACGCCRREQEEYEEFLSLEEAIDFAAKQEFRRKYPEFREDGDDGDVSVLEILVVAKSYDYELDSLLQDRIQTLFDEKEKERIKKEKAQKKRQATLAKKKAEEQERKEKEEYERLKAKFEGK